VSCRGGAQLTCSHHGWAAARADLSDPENRKQFDDVYQRLADYFARVNA
jgi:hypothetical protein